ncbi:E3 ubiquitin-protein ligase RNF168 [Liparis tanakae]|uniref:RING-type E3 ubiquitin transferase n=1 Tax=Liparis tanakae TaxID=230148 RepID=A0A4Z2EHR8_9TELE|nr:E3 ubiquitin-protein ligase RNF168 [Liparis tanakae]
MREVKVSEGRRGRVLSLDDCRCPVCLEMFLEPVTLPCTHTFCKACFLESVDKATLCCPLCRKRVSTWARLNSRNRTLVDQQLWDQIQTRFPLQCQRRLTGEGEEPGVAVCSPRVCRPGELKQEYEAQVSQRLLAEEEELQQEETRRRHDDERLARRLSSQLNPVPVPQGPAAVIPAKKKKKEVGGGQMEKFLSPVAPSSLLANKENILLPPERPPPPQTAGPPPATSPSGELQTPGSHMTGEGSEEEKVTKRGCRASSSLEVGGPAWVGIAELEAELVSRRQQEEEDRRLALLLQKELDQQEKHRATDRRRGSSDPYLLRPRESGRPPRKKSKTSSSTKTRDTPPSSAKTSSSSSSSSRRQATLPEAFSGLSGERSSSSSSSSSSS